MSGLLRGFSRISVLAASALFLVACASQGKPVAVDLGMFGMVYGRDGSPVGAARVAVDGAPATASDSSGRFFLRDVNDGFHVLEVTKDGYETWRGDFERRESSDVLYVKLVSAAWLIDEAERAASVLDWARALDSVNRALAIRADDPVAAFILGIIALRSPASADEARRAADLLEGAATRGEREPSLFLLLAELYKSRLADPEAELRALRMAGESRRSPENELRMSELESLLAGAVPAP
ncbi:MAG: carboxypeptidase regulatory-like domain-containing protein [Spirochaetales bacterium]|nr:carboxypeptidase regulatory-like domain-containing protein [Spirochaetales bacterium]